MSVDGDGGLDIAVVGSGITGMACAWALGQKHRITLFEAAERLGGHTNTVLVSTQDGRQPIDTGFIVYNEAAYPNLTALFAHLCVATQPSEMSFAVSLDAGALEYSGGTIKGLFAQPSNLLNPRFLAMLRDLLRFYREAPGKLTGLEGITLGAFLERDGYGRAFRDDHLLPMAAAIWSSPRGTLLDYPAASFVQFCENHGLLKIAGRPIWRFVAGGSATYISPLTRPYRDGIRLGCRVTGVTRGADRAVLHTSTGETLSFDAIVVAAHANDALALLDQPREADRTVLGAFRYSDNRAVLHSDERFMPRRKAAWSSWNYIGQREAGATALSVTYWMNRLQDLPGKTNYFVTLNPSREPDGILHEDAYSHPIFDLAALAAQKRLWSLQGDGRVWFCGAHFGAGFHEDGLQAGLAVAEAIGGIRRPWAVPGESSRIDLPAGDGANRVAAWSEMA